MAFVTKQRGSQFWYICWAERIDGKTHWLKRSTGEIDREKAQQLLELFQSVKEGRAKRDRLAELIRAAGIQAVAQEVDLADLWDWYVSHCDVSGAERQRRDRLNALNRFIAWMSKKHPEYRRVQEISLRLAFEYWQVLAEKGDAPSTRNNNLSALNTIWSSIQAPMELPLNPWSAIKRDSSGSIPYQPFTAAELAALRAAARITHLKRPSACKAGSDQRKKPTSKTEAKNSKQNRRSPDR